MPILEEEYNVLMDIREIAYKYYEDTGSEIIKNVADWLNKEIIRHIYE